MSFDPARSNDGSSRGLVLRQADRRFKLQPFAEWSLPVTEDRLRGKHVAVINQEAGGESPPNGPGGPLPDQADWRIE